MPEPSPVEHLLNQLPMRARATVTFWNKASMEGDGTSFASYVKDVRESMILVEPPAESGIRLPSGTKVGVLLDLGSSLATVYPVVTTFQAAGLVGYWLTLSPDVHIEYQNRRNFHRVPTIQPVQVRFTHQTGQTSTVEGLTQDLSAGGMRLLAPCRFGVGASLCIHMVLEQNRPPMDLNGRVVDAKHPAEPNNKGLYTHSVAFDGLSKLVQNALVAFCFKQELKQQQSKG